MRMGGTEYTVPMTTSFSKVIHANLNEVESGFGCGERSWCLNGFPFSIMVITRSGFAFEVPPSKGRKYLPGCFQFRKRWVIGRDVILDDHQLYNVISDQVNQEVGVLKELALGMHNTMSHWGDKEIALDYQVSLEDFQAAGRSMYLPEADIVITDINNRRVVHPESIAGKKLRAVSDIEEGGFQLNIEIVDPNGVLGHRYINFGGKVFRVKTINDPLRKPGIYYTGNVKPEGQLDLGIPGFMEFHELSGADGALAMYRTVDEAMTHGNLAESLKREAEIQLARSKLEIVRLEQQMERDKAEHQITYNRLLNQSKTADEEREQHKRRADELAQRLKEERERETARLKDEYERRSYERKDSNDFLKWIPAILGLVSAIIVLVVKLAGG